MHRICLLIVIGLFIPLGLLAQMVKGTVYEMNPGQKEPLPAVNVYWEGSQIATTTDQEGKFALYKPDYYSKLIFSFVGYKTDTIQVDKPTDGVTVFLVPGTTLKEVTIEQRGAGAHIDRLSTILTEKITTNELAKAACCNLAESFTTNASVDTYYANAVTGAKQIRLLGLDGVYVQMLTENIPNMRGIASTFGLTYIPGPWMEGIMISKGTASVKNGYESIAGQIDVEYLKPVKADPLLLNLFLSDAGRTEGNFASALKINKHLSTLLMGHYSQDQTKEDHNSDGFLDEPLYRQYNVMNRWYFENNHIRMHAGIKLLKEDRYSGQMTYHADSVRDIDHPYGIGIQTKRAEGFLKLGYVFNNQMKSSFGSINSISWHEQNSYYGLRNYLGKQLNYFLNLMYETNVFNDQHTWVSGFTFNLDNYSETMDYQESERFERVPGIYTEYSYKPAPNFNLMTGVRLDYHNLYGWMFTPRLHAKYDLNSIYHFRLSAGKGYRSPMILAENNHFLANSRDIIIDPDLKQEEAWNYGLSATRDFPIGVKPLSVAVEYYRTDFLEQIIVDLDSNVNQVRFSNLQGKSFSNNLQIEINTQFIKGLDAKFAWRLSDVEYDLNQQLVTKPLVSKYKGLVVLSYQTHMKKWQFDATWQLNGPGRIPSTEANPAIYQMDQIFDPYHIVNLQITKYFKTWEVYGGIENLTDFRQKHAIISGDQPFSEYFDSSLIWGPLHGRKMYVGFRYRIPQRSE